MKTIENNSISNHSTTNNSVNMNNPFQSTAMALVQRDDIPSLMSVMVNGEKHNLGLVKDFRKNEILSNFLTEKTERVSFSWVRLLSGETLAVHAHPTSSMILICEGTGYCTGDISGHLQTGSIVTVPPNCLHGFCGSGEKGFWGLSIQFESDGLYENILEPRVSFNSMLNDQNGLDLILQAHDFFMQDFKKNEFCLILESEHIKNSEVLNKFLDNIQYFSQRFQGILKVRLDHALSDIEKELALDHLEEEKDHDTNFAKYRNNQKITSADKEIVEISDWFEQAMATHSDSEKIILMHFVLEGSGQLAHSLVYPVVEHLPVKKHFLVHQEEDEEHFLMGVDGLKNMNDLNIEKLLTTLITGWSKMNRLCECMAITAYQN